MRSLYVMATLGLMGAGFVYFYRQPKQNGKIFIFFEARPDPLPTKIMRQLLPFFKNENVTTFCAAQPINETKNWTIEQLSSEISSLKKQAMQNHKLHPTEEKRLHAQEEYIAFLKSLSEYQIAFKAVDMAHQGIAQGKIAAWEEHNKFMVDRIIESGIEKLVMLVGLNHKNIACELVLRGYHVHAYYLPSRPVGEKFDILDVHFFNILARPNTNQHKEIFKTKFGCHGQGLTIMRSETEEHVDISKVNSGYDESLVVLNVIDLSLNDKLNPAEMIVKDYHDHEQESVLSGDSSGNNANAL